MGAYWDCFVSVQNFEEKDWDIVELMSSRQKFYAKYEAQTLLPFSSIGIFLGTEKKSSAKPSKVLQIFLKLFESFLIEPALRWELRLSTKDLKKWPAEYLQDIVEFFSLLSFLVSVQSNNS